MKLNRLIALAAAIVFTAGLAGAKVMDATVATVNSKAILSSEYDKLKKAVLEEYKKNAPQLLEKKDNVTAIEEEVLNQMITDALLVQAAQTEGIKVKDSEIADGINEVKMRFAKDKDGKPITDKKLIEKNFNDELKKEDITYKQFENRIKDQIAVRKLLDTVVRARATQPTKEQTKKLYEDIMIILKGDKKVIEKMPREDIELAAPLAAKLAQLTAEQIKISPIFIKIPMVASDIMKKDREKELKDIKKDIESGKISFTQAIEKYSDDKSVLATGGEAILIRGIMPKEFDDVVFNIPVGKISDPIKTEQGFYLIRVNAKTAKKDVAFEQIESDLAQYLASASMQKASISYLTSLKEKADIKVLVKFNYETPPAPRAEPKKEQPAKPEEKKEEPKALAQK